MKDEHTLPSMSVTRSGFHHLRQEIDRQQYIKHFDNSESLLSILTDGISLSKVQFTLR